MAVTDGAGATAPEESSALCFSKLPIHVQELLGRPKQRDMTGAPLRLSARVTVQLYTLSISARTASACEGERRNGTDGSEKRRTMQTSAAPGLPKRSSACVHCNIFYLSNRTGTGRYPPEPRFHPYSFYSCIRLGDREQLELASARAPLSRAPFLILPSTAVDLRGAAASLRAHALCQPSHRHKS